MDQFEGYECLLPVILLTSDDPVIGRTEKRLLLQLYSERIQELGARRMVGRVADILNEEYKYYEARRERFRQLNQESEM